MYWITNNIGTSSFEEAKRIQDKDIVVISAIDLHDGWENPERIYLKLKESLVYLHHRRKVVFVCVAGISRSNGLATTLLAYLNNIDWDDAENLVRKKVRRAQINRDFRDSCLIALQIAKERLIKTCPYCSCPIENWESACEWCWYRGEINESG